MINKLKEWAIAHKQATIGICVAVAVVIATGIGYAVVNHSTEPDSTASAQTQETSDATSDETNNDPVAVKIDPKADDSWKDDSSPVILHVQSKDADNDTKSHNSDSTKASDAKASVDFYHATSHGADNDTIDLVPGNYTVTVVSPVNSDGSIEVYANDNDAKSVTKSIDVTVKPVKTKSDDTKSEGVKSGEAKTTDEAKSDDTKSEDIKSDETKATEDAKSDDKPQTIEIPMTNVPAEQVTDDMVKTIVDKTKTAVDNGDTTLKGDAGKEVLDKVETNAKANPNVTEATTEKAEENKTTADTSTETAKPTTAPSANKSDSDSAKSSGSSNAGQPKNESSTNNDVSQTTQAPAVSNSNTSSGSSNKPAEKPKKWVPEQGHYEDVTEQVWVSNWVEEPVYETKKVQTNTRYIFAEDGYTTTNDDDFREHSIELMKKGYAGNYRTEPIYETQTVQTGTKKVDKGGYQTEVTGKKWVVDVAGHWED